MTNFYIHRIGKLYDISFYIEQITYDPESGNEPRIAARIYHEDGTYGVVTTNLSNIFYDGRRCINMTFNNGLTYKQYLETLWQPMESAPKNGQRILVKDKDEYRYIAAWLRNKQNYPDTNNYAKCEWCIPESWQDEQGGYETLTNLVSWQPIP